MEKKFLELKFTKDFFAALLHTSAKKIRYGLLVYEEGEHRSYHAALIVRGISHYAFDIENSIFVWLEQDFYFEKAQTILKKDKVTFKSETAEIDLELALFYNHYATRCVNSLLLD